jgi:cytoskeletal protein CcmA (bactofilin family)
MSPRWYGRSSINNCNLSLHFLYGTFGKNAFFLPERVEVNGSIEAAVPGQIDGYVKGDVRTPGKLLIGKKARIQGNVYAGELVLYGRIHGNVFVTNKAALSGKAYVRGDVTAMVLDIEGEAIIDGAIWKNIGSEARPETEDGNPAEAGQEAATGQETAESLPLPAGPDNGAMPAEAATGKRPILEEEENATSWF